LKNAAMIAVVAAVSVLSVAGLAVAVGPVAQTLSTSPAGNDGRGMMDGGMMHNGEGGYQNHGNSGSCPMYYNWEHDWNYSYDRDNGGCPCMS
jgi:opacity protein-like surface antigen